MPMCIDYPCCGHTAEDPCERQWYDEPDAFDTSRPGNEHALCDHENGDCEVDDYDPDDDGPACPWCQDEDSDVEPADADDAAQILCRPHLAEYESTSPDELDRREETADA